MPARAELAAFGLVIDGVRFVVVRPAADTVADTTVALPPDATELALDLRVPLVTSPETLSVSIVALSGTTSLFRGTRLVPVPSALPPTEIPVNTYIGPAADSIAIQPRTAFIGVSDSLRFQVLGFTAGVPVTQFFVAWSTSDSALARINRFGVLRAPGSRATLRVRARTPSGVSDSVTATFVPSATQLIAIAGSGQTDTVGSPLTAPLEVEARAPDGLGVGGVSVRFRPLVGGGAVADTVVVTDGAGRARTTVTLGSAAGAQSFEASAAGLGGSPVTFSAFGFAAGATRLVATPGGDLQSAVVGTAVAIAPAVRAQDQFGNAVPGASITFAVSGGGGSVTGAAQLTNGAGVATVGSWTLGTTAGTDTLTATLSGVTPLKFTARGIAGAATQIAQLTGDGQTAVVNAILPTVPAVIVRDQFNNPVPGVGVSFAPASGGGSVTGASATTDTTGVARVGSWRLGVLVGQNTLAAGASGLGGSPVTFVANGTRDVAAQLLRVSIDTQTAIAGQPVSVLPAARVADQYGNAVPGASVTFTLTGVLIGSVTPSPATTDSLGVARVTNWTLAASPGVNTLDAAASGLAGSPLTFSANGITTTASTIALGPLGGGDGQTGVVNTALSAAYSVSVKDAVGLPVPNVQVHWAVGPAGGSMNPATSPTDSNGIATSTRTLGVGAGTQTAFAAVGGLAGSPVTFTATALPSAAARLLPQSVNQQTGTVGTAVTAPVVKVTDQFDNAVAGVIVDFVATGGGALGAIKDTSDAAGLATTGSWTLGSLVGTNTVTVGAGALPAVTFTATSVAGAPAGLAFLTEPGRSLAGDAIEPAPRVEFQDAFGNIAAGATGVVTLKIGATPDPDAKLVGTLDVDAVAGVATFADVSIDSAGAGYKVDATAGAFATTSAAFDIGGVIDAITFDRWQPVAAAVNPVTDLVYIPGLNNNVGVFDPGKRQLIQVPGFQAPFGVALNSMTNMIYVTTLEGVVVMDGQDNARGQPIAVGLDPKGIAVDEETDRIFVVVTGDPSNGDPPRLVILDGKDRVIIGSIPFKEGTPPGIGVAFNKNDRLVYVAIPNLGVGVFDPSKLEHVVTLPIVGEKGAAGTYGVAVDVRTNLLYATNRAEHTVSVIELSTLKEIQRLRVGLAPEGLGVDAGRGGVYVANSGENTVSFIDAGKLAVFATLIVGPTPKAAAVNPLTGQFYVPTFTDDRVRVVQP